MRRARGFWIAVLAVTLAGCLSTKEQRAKWTDPFDLFAPGRETDTASVHYVLIERPAGGDEINRRVWDQIDEQLLPFETRTSLEAAGLRVGKVGGTMPGPLRRLFDNPRTRGGHRGRFFALDKPFPIATTERLPKVDFPVADPDGGPTRFAKDQAALGFDVTVRETPDGGIVVKLVPHAKFRDPSRLLLGELADGDQATELFQAAEFELPLAANEYLVIGTDSYRDDTFGHAALIGDKDEEPVQRLIVLWAGLTRTPRAGGTDASAPPLAAQAGVARP